MTDYFIKKPIPIEAHQWFANGDHPLDYAEPKEGFELGELVTFSPEHQRSEQWEGQVVRYYRSPRLDGQDACKHCGQIMHIHGWIDTLEGGHIVCPSDWIITGVRGERYPIKDAIFKETYAPAPPPPSHGADEVKP